MLAKHGKKRYGLFPGRMCGGEIQTAGQPVEVRMSKMLEGAVQTESGVMFNGIPIQAVVEQCAGCERVRLFAEQEFCGSYAVPARKWAGGRCNFATHIKTAVAAGAKVNPLKASKRAAKGR